MTESDRDDEYEDALKECGFGIFNICIYLAVFGSSCAWVFSMTYIPYIVPQAECDLDMSIYEKTLVTNFMYLGMIVGAIPLAFCADIFGRRKVLIFGHLLDALLAILTGFTQSSAHLIAVRFFQGVVSGGSYAICIAYVSELHTKYLRGFALMLMQLFFVLSDLILPIVAYFIVQSHKTVRIGDLTLHNWNFFLFYSCLPSLISSIAYFFLPESPKFLLCKRRTSEAIKAIGKMYDLNKLRNKGNCPIKSFSNRQTDEELPEEKFWKRVGSKIVEGLKQEKIIFAKKYSKKTVLFCIIMFIVCWVYNSLFDWMPDVLHIMQEIITKGEDFEGICMVIEYINSNTKFNKSESEPESPEECYREPEGLEYYFHDHISNFVSLGIYTIMAMFLKCAESRTILISTVLVNLMFTVIFYFAITPTMVNIVSAFIISGSNIVETILIIVTVNSFPTQVRAMIVMFLLIICNIATIIDILVHPHIIAAGCTIFFAHFGGFQLLTLFFGFFIPNTKNVAII